MTFEEWCKLPEVKQFMDDIDENEHPIIILKRLQKFCFEEGQKYPKETI